MGQETQPSPERSSFRLTLSEIRDAAMNRIRAEHEKTINPWLSCITSQITGAMMTLVICEENEREIATSLEAKLRAFSNKVEDLKIQYPDQEHDAPEEVWQPLVEELKNILS